MIYYNDHDPDAVRELVRLIGAGALPHGDADSRDIQEVTGKDLSRYSQCHFFAGIGGWPLALTTAGWPPWMELWSGSAPCQPFSSAGSRKGEDDERHVWPEFHRLIEERRPAVVLGEQVASKLGRVWVEGVRADMESSGYAFTWVVLPAASVGAPHRRDRIWWVADSGGDQQHGRGIRSSELSRHRGHARCDPAPWGDPGWVRCDGRPLKLHRIGEILERSRPSHRIRYRPVPPEPALFPLAYGVPEGMERLRGYGNAIVPQVAEVFVRSYMEARGIEPAHEAWGEGPGGGA